ncbi:dynein light chain Tctex-type 5-B-like [Mercenaria mercenaria]|uniref:dynein light chain Tctex-type 5-B-like n=1 Tax=Mercenaria mercenaria TaxID=6596 RepID=UPI00234EB81C|nr:dynein light chain Tctex-type 5-B-like [Mercenaria mercenaria]XP_053394090.1 dynein light chain Tctex-type 5-B-like [Mercenaria mercenaria]
MGDHDKARDKAARLLKKQGSMSSLASIDIRHDNRHHKHGPSSMSTVSFMDEPGHEDHFRPQVKCENTYQLEPKKKFPAAKVKHIIHDVLESYLAEEKYEPELCRQMSKTISEVIKARVKEMMIPRFKVICLVHIGQLSSQGLRIGSRCLWDDKCDTFSTSEFRNRSIFAIGSVYGVYYE